MPAGVPNTLSVTPLAMAGPVGLNPALAIALFGLAVFFGAVPPVPGLEPLFHPAAAFAFLGVGVLLHVGRSAKLSKPFAEAAGLFESLLGVIVTGLLVWPSAHPSGGATLEAGLGTALLIVAASVLGVLSMIVLRTAFDLLIWVTPIPFVDAVFQVLKAVVTLGLVALAIFAPVVAIIVNVVILLGTTLALRWAVRAARYGLTVAYDLTLGALDAAKELPTDPVAEGDVGPFLVFSERIPGIKRRAQGSLECNAGWWIVTFPRTFGEPRTLSLGEAEKAELSSAWNGTTLTTPAGSVLLPPRYRHLHEPLARRTKAQTARARPNRPIAQPASVL